MLSEWNKFYTYNLVLEIKANILQAYLKLMDLELQ